MKNNEVKSMTKKVHKKGIKSHRNELLGILIRITCLKQVVSLIPCLTDINF